MFSYFVVVSYPHWFKFCQKCDIKYRIHNYHFFHTFVENPLMLHGLPEIWHIFGRQFEICAFMYNFLVNSLSFSCGYILICFLWKWEEKNELNVNIRDGSDMMILLLLAKQIDMSEGFFFWWRRKWVYVLDFEKGWLWCRIFELRLCLPLFNLIW